MKSPKKKEKKQFEVYQGNKFVGYLPQKQLIKVGIELLKKFTLSN